MLVVMLLYDFERLYYSEVGFHVFLLYYRTVQYKKATSSILTYYC